MTERRFAPGDIIYREGDRSDFAGLVLSGRVELMRGEPGSGREVEIVGPGEVFGELGLILNQRRTVTAMAVDVAIIRMVDRWTFLNAINQKPEIARPLMRALILELVTAEIEPRLRGGPEQAGPTLELSADRDEGQPEPPPAQPAAGGPAAEAGPGPSPSPSGFDPAFEPGPGLATLRVRVLPASAELVARMAPEGLTPRLPFRVGRRTIKGEIKPTEENDLAFADAKPFNLSRRHFVIEGTRQGLMLRDCGSQLGTLVNGTRIGARTDSNVALLKAGDNDVVAGGDDSPFRFTVRIEQG